MEIAIKAVIAPLRLCQYIVVYGITERNYTFMNLHPFGIYYTFTAISDCMHSFMGLHSRMGSRLFVGINCWEYVCWDYVHLLGLITHQSHSVYIVPWN